MKLFSIFIRELKNAAHLILGLAAITFYGNPSKNLKIIGITGTDGKTTTAYFTYQLLEKLGKRAALFSTVGVFMNGKRQPLGFHVTTPSPFKINKYIKEAKKNNIEYIVIEVSSHALDQHRVFGIHFDVGTITNITNEHLDYHRSFSRYLNAKIKLLNKSRFVVLNNDDPNLSQISKKINKKIYTYSLTNENVDFSYSNIKSKSIDLFTEYNKNNLMASILILKLLGLEPKDFDHLELPEGRLQYLQEKPFKVIVDFAHTPNAFNSLLPEIKNNTKSRVIHVFGSAGKRDRQKRPEMGRNAAVYDDIIILTSEDPRDESVKDINKDIKKGIDKNFRETSMQDIDNKTKSIVEIDDRREAIRFALKIAQEDDTVLITGKGPEESMNMGNGEIPWNDIEITKNLLTKL